MAVVVLLPDSYDLIGMTDQPFGVPLLDGASVTHPVDVLVRMDIMDTVMARGIPRLASPIIADDRLGEILADIRAWVGFAWFSGYGRPDTVPSGAGASRLLLEYGFCLWHWPGVWPVVGGVQPAPEWAVGFSPSGSWAVAGGGWAFWPVRLGSVSPDSDVSESPAGIHSRVARPSGLGGLGLYKDWSRDRATTSRSTGDWVTSLRVSYLSCDWVVGAAHAAWTSAVDDCCWSSYILCSVVVVHHAVRDGLAATWYFQGVWTDPTVGQTLWFRQCYHRRDWFTRYTAWCSSD